MSNLNNSTLNGFSVLLYYHFISKKKYRVDEIAEKMGIAADTLYRYVRGENIIPPDRIVALLKATDEIEFINYFLDPCGYIPIKNINRKENGDPMDHLIIMLSILTGRVQEESDKALRADGRFDKQEAARTLPYLDKLIRAATTFKEKIKAEVRR